MATDNRAKLEAEYQQRFGVAWDDKVDRVRNTTRSLRMNWLRRRARELDVADYPGAPKRPAAQVQEVAPEEPANQTPTPVTPAPTPPSGDDEEPAWRKGRS